MWPDRRSASNPGCASVVTVSAVVGLSAVPLALLLRAEYARPLPCPLLAFIALGLALIASSWR